MRTTTLSSSKPVQILMICLLLSGCAKPESMAKHIAAGAVIGAGASALAAVATGGCVGCGLAVGAAVGAGLGVAFDALENKR